MADDIEAKRHTAAYEQEAQKLRRTTNFNDAEIDRLALEAVEHAVFGFDAVKNSKGEYQQQGIGSASNPSINSLMALRKYEGEESYRRAVAKLWKENSAWAAAHNLPKPAAT